MGFRVEKLELVTVVGLLGGLEEAFLRFFEVDDVPDGVEILAIAKFIREQFMGHSDRN